MHFERGVRFSVVKVAFLHKANFMENSKGKGDRLPVSVEYNIRQSLDNTGWDVGQAMAVSRILKICFIGTKTSNER